MCFLVLLTIAQDEIHRSLSNVIQRNLKYTYVCVRIPKNLEYTVQ